MPVWNGKSQPFGGSAQNLCTPEGDQLHGTFGMC